MALSVGLDYRDNGFNPSILSFFALLIIVTTAFYAF